MGVVHGNLTRAVVIFVFTLVTASASLHTAAVQTGPPRPRSLLAAFYSDSVRMPEALQTLPIDTRNEIERRLAIRRSYKPLTAIPTGPVTIEQEIASNKRQLEIMVVAIVGSTSVGREAARFAQEIGLAYEYEGDSSLPIREAEDAAQYVRDHPKTALAPALHLFSLERHRHGFEMAASDNDRTAMARAAGGYRAVLQRLRASPDPIAVVVAEDLDALPYLYGNTAQHPRTFRARQQ